jgi:sugar (pentulose or hexulose) kinase
MAIVIGIDLGTTTTTAVAVDTDAWRIVASHTLPTPRPQGMERCRTESDAEALVRTGREALEHVSTGAVAGVGITGQQHGVVVVDDDLRPLTPFIGWQDKRADGEVLARARELVGDTRERTGCRLSNGYGSVSLFWLKQRGELPKGTVCTLMDYFAASLTGGRPVTEPTCAASLGCFDVARGEWDEEILRGLGLPRQMFPEVRRAGTRLGHSNVFVGIGDNQASFLGSVRQPASTVLVNVGTGGQVSAYSPTFALADTVEARPFPGGEYLLVSAGLCGGASLMVVLNAFQAPLEASGGREPTGEAANIPRGCDGLICDPFFHGSRHDPNKRGSFTGITATNFTPAHMVRAVMEGMARVFAGSYDRLKGLRGPASSLAGAGNGLQANPLLVRIVEEAFEMPLSLSPHREEAAYGAALVAAVGAGLSPGFLHARPT